MYNLDIPKKRESCMKNPTYEQTRWSLTDLLPECSEEEVQKALAEVEETVRAIEGMRPALSPEMKEDDFSSLLELLERFAEGATRLGGYATLWHSEETQNHDALAFMGRVEQTLTEAHNRVLFVSLWWKSLAEHEAEALMAHAGDLRYYLEKLRLFKPHTLSEPEEKIINIKDVNGVSALNTIYGMITNKFVFELDVDGKKKHITREELMTYVRNPSAHVREAAYRELYRVFGEEATVLGQVYIHTVRDWRAENMGLRHFASPIAARNLVNHLPDDVVETLLRVCAEETRVFQRYFTLKAGWLGMERLRRFDLYAPLSEAPSENIPYPEAVDMVLESFHQFSPEVEGMARKVFDESHIDAEVRQGKRGGAFCLSVSPASTPWVLANYTGEPRQVATLAHELGHAVHSLMAAGHSPLTFQAPLPLAETASVFGEMLLTDRLLELEKDPLVRRDILAETIDSIYATVMRQAFFVLFEREAHEAVAAGKTIDQLHDLYRKNLEAQFGESMDVEKVFRHEWVGIPHIYHVPFYCYAYSFGMLLALALYEEYRERGRAFVPRLTGILAAGGAENPDQVLTAAGVDMHKPEFWRGGFRIIEHMIRELEETGAS
jgi:oligoendopeptidase F